jgi:hypothetical protein
MRALYLASVWLHVAAAMTWVGGMVTFAAAVMPYAGGVVAAALSAGCAPRVAEAQTVAPVQVQGGEWFVQTGCTACHSMAVYRIFNLAAVGPDLSLAVEDAPKRFGVSLDEFLRAPTGTMAMVLSSRIPMSDEQRTVAIEKLKEAYRKHQDSSGAGRPVASH